MKRRWWLISIGGYGDFGYYGTEAEAEKMRAHKAVWEAGVGRKTAISATHPSAKKAMERVKWERKQGYGLDERELASIGVF